MDQQTFFGLIPEAVAKLFSGGAFLMAGSGKPNPMTIGWAQFGDVWGKPMVTVFVRKSRYTYGLMEAAETFSVSVPKLGTMVKELAFCGTKSGRDVDKLAGAGLSVLPARCGGADGIAGCDSHFECRIVFKAESNLEWMDPAIRARYYGPEQAFGNGDPHVIYFGEVIGAYQE